VCIVMPGLQASGLHDAVKLKRQLSLISPLARQQQDPGKSELTGRVAQTSVTLCNRQIMGER